MKQGGTTYALKSDETSVREEHTLWFLNSWPVDDLQRIFFVVKNTFLVVNPAMFSRHLVAQNIIDIYHKPTALSRTANDDRRTSPRSSKATSVVANVL